MKKLFLLTLILSSCASRPPCKGLTHNCNNGDGEACYVLGNAVFGTIDKGADKKLAKEKAGEWYKKGCDLGNKKSCTAHEVVRR